MFQNPPKDSGHESLAFGSNRTTPPDLRIGSAHVAVRAGQRLVYATTSGSFLATRPTPLHPFDGGSSPTSTMKHPAQITHIRDR